MGSHFKSVSLATSLFNMYSRMVIFAGLLVLLYLVDSGSSQSPLYCYQCNSYDDINFADPFYYEEEAHKRPWERMPKDPTLLKPCEEQATMCRKIVTNVRGEERIIRACGWVQDREDRPCYRTVLGEYDALICSCNEAGCNGATGYSISFIPAMPVLTNT